MLTRSISPFHRRSPDHALDPDDETPVVGYKARRGYVHSYYEMAYGMVEEILQDV